MKSKKVLAIFIVFAMVMGIAPLSFAEPTEDFHVEESTEATEAAKGPVVEEYMVYTDDNKRIEPGSLTGDVNLSTVGKGLYFDGTDFYFFLDTGIMATNFMYNIQGDRFFFGEDGKMVKDELITYDSELYYFDINGAMYKNRWYTAEEVDTYENTITYTDYYFGPTGRAYRAGDNSAGLVIKTIDGEKYGFNSDGEKVEGYYDHSGTKYDQDEVEAYANCEYYFDPEENGAATKGWHYYSGSVRGTEYDDNEEIVLYFDEKTCKKVKSVSSDESRSVSRTIEGQRYMFDFNGVRKNKWYKTEPGRATRSNMRYFAEDYDGYLQKGWFTAVPPEDSILEINRKRHDNNEDVWYYAGTNGSIYRKCIRKIGAYTYAFDDDGVMQEDCLVRTKGGRYIKSYKTENLYKGNVLNDPNEYGNAEEGKDPTSDPENLDKNKGLLQGGEQWMYFMGDQKGDDKLGAMCPLNNPYTIELNDEDVYFVANSTGGYTIARNVDGLTGLYAETVTRNSKYIQNGCLLKPNKDDNNFGIIRVNVTQRGEEKAFVNWKNIKFDVPAGAIGSNILYKYMVVNGTGGLVPRGPKCVKDKQGYYIYYWEDGEFIGYYSCEGRCTKAKNDGWWKSRDYKEDSTGTVISGYKMPIVGGQYYWEHKVDKDWEWGLPAPNNRVKVDYISLNFGTGARADLNGEADVQDPEEGAEPSSYDFGPYRNGLAAFVYENPVITP